MSSNCRGDSRPPLTLLCVLVVTLCALALPALAQPAGPARGAKYYEDALLRYERNDLAGAAVQLRNAIQNDRKNIAAQLLLGRVLMGTGELKAAEAALEEALRQGVSMIEIAPLLGQVYLQLGDSKKLLDTITTTGMPAALLPEILTLRGTAQAMSGSLDAASASFTQARQLDPKAAGPYIAEAPLLLRFGEGERARVTALKATQLAPDNAMAWYQLGTIQHALRDTKSAMVSLDKALAIKPKLVDALVARAAVLMATNQLDEAAVLLDKLKQDKVSEPRASFLRAVLASNKGNSLAAQAEFTQAANLIDSMPPGLRNSSEPFLMAGALSHRALGNPQRAREYVETILTRNGRHFAAQLLLANVLLEAKETSRAVPVLEDLLRTAPNEPQVLYMMGSVFLARKQYVQASEMFDRAAKAGTSNDALRELAFSQFGLQQDKTALANLEKAYAKAPRDYRAGVELSIYYARHGQAAKAVKIAEDLVQIDPSNVAMVNFLGNIKGRLGDNAGMRAAFDQALGKDPKFRPTVINLSLLDIDEGKLDAARKRLNAWLKLNPSDGEALFQLGMVEQRANKPALSAAIWTKADGLQNKDPRPGLALIDQLLQLRQHPQALAAAKTLAGKYPESVPVLQALGRARLASKDLTMARQALQEASKYAGADPLTQVNISRLQLAAGNPDGALHAVNKALQSSPDDIGALVMIVEIAARRGDAAAVDAGMKQLRAKHAGKLPTLLTAGHVAFSRRQLPQAISQYEAALASEPSTPVALVLAQAFLANNQTDKALSLLGEVTRKDPRDASALRALAQVQAAAGKNAQALASLAALVTLNPDDPDALAGYAQMLHRMNDPKALATAEKAMKMQPDNAALAGGYGWMLVHKGELESGIRILREARLRDPGDGVIRWNLASALAKAGRKAEARDELRAALASGSPPNPGPELNALKAELGL